MQRPALVFAFVLVSGCTADDDAASDVSSEGTIDDDGVDDGFTHTHDQDTGHSGNGDDEPQSESSGASTSSGSGEAETSDEGGDLSQTNGSSTGDDGGASVECAALMECCDQLGADIYVGCVSVVDLEMPGLCDQILATYHQDGYCTGETFCDDLSSCCDELPLGQGWQDTCTYYADLGNQPQCAMLISDYQLSGYCF